MASIFTRIVNGEIPSYKVAENEKFYVLPEAYEYFEEKRKELAEAEENWKKEFEAWSNENPELAKKWDAFWNEKATAEVAAPSYNVGDKLATRDASGKSLNCMSDRYEWLVGGSADLQGPNKTKVKKSILFPLGCYLSLLWCFGNLVILLLLTKFPNILQYEDKDGFHNIFVSLLALIFLAFLIGNFDFCDVGGGALVMFRYIAII